MPISGKEIISTKCTVSLFHCVYLVPSPTQQISYSYDIDCLCWKCWQTPTDQPTYCCSCKKKGISTNSTCV